MVAWSANAETLSGLPRRQALGRFLWDVYEQLLPGGPAARQIWQGRKDLLVEGLKQGRSAWDGRPLRIEIARTDGIEINLEIQAIVIPTQKGSRFVILTCIPGSEAPFQDSLSDTRAHYQALFSDSPIGLLEEDLSGVKRYFADLHHQGVDDFKGYLSEHPAALREAILAIRILNVNRAALDLFGFQTRDEFIEFCRANYLDDPRNLAGELLMVAEGDREFRGTATRKIASGEIVEISVDLLVVPGHETDYSRAILSIRNLTEQRLAHQALRFSEVRYQSIFEESPIALWELDFSAARGYLDRLRAAGVQHFGEYLAAHPADLGENYPLPTILNCNRAALDLTHCASIAEMKIALVEHFAPWLIGFRTCLLNNLAEGTHKFEYQLSFSAPDGQAIHISLKWMAIPGFEDSLGRVLLSGIDISDSINNQQALRHFTDRLQALYEVDRAILRVKEPKEVAAAALASMGHLVPCQHVDVLMINMETGVFECLAYQDTEQPALGFLSDLPLADREHVINQLQKGEIFQSEDFSADRANPTRIRSLIAAPMVDQGRLFGVINLSDPKVGFFKGEDVEIAREVATSLAVALENARLLEVERTARNQMYRLAGYLQAAREEERAQIAREIHDELGQSLTALKMDLAWMVQNIPMFSPETSRKTFGLLDSIDQIIFQVQRIAAELRPGILDNLGLVAAIEWQSQEFNGKTGIKVNLRLPEEEQNLGNQKSTALFRIFQESLTNIWRHAHATTVWVELRQADGDALMTIRDNGQGITQDEIHDPGSFGLIGMRERALLCGGNVTILPAPQNGTLVTARVPLEQDQKGVK